MPPHLAFANLRAEDPKSVEAFIKRYGVLFHSERRAEALPPDKGSEFSIKTFDLIGLQDALQEAWGGISFYISDIQCQVDESMTLDSVHIHVAEGVVWLRTEDVWTMICFLFLLDFTAGKLGICENPACPAPYFKKRRSTQKYCEAGPCVEYAQRQYALKWWNAEGKKRREEEQSRRQAKRQNRKRNKQ